MDDKDTPGLSLGQGGIKRNLQDELDFCIKILPMSLFTEFHNGGIIQCEEGVCMFRNLIGGQYHQLACATSDNLLKISEPQIPSLQN